MGSIVVKTPNGIKANCTDDQPTLECIRFANVLERIVLAFRREVSPACLNFLLKSQALLIYRLAHEAGGGAAASEIVRTIKNGPPPNAKRRHAISRAHSHHRSRDVVKATPRQR